MLYVFEIKFTNSYCHYYQ